MQLRTLEDMGEVSGRYVLVRGSLNVPVAAGVVNNDFRLRRLLPTLHYLCEQGAKVVLIGHIGREPEETLQPVCEALQSQLSVTWGGTIGSDEFSQKHAALADGEVLLAENLRQDSREQENNADFAAELASLAEFYVNEAFDNTHREHASMVGVPMLLPAYAGRNVVEEVQQLTAARSPSTPSLCLLGGAKFDTKLPLITQLLEVYDRVFVGGALAHDLFIARGLPVGRSLHSDAAVSADIANHPKLLLPVDVTVEPATGGDARVCTPEEVQPDEIIKDAGPKTIALLEPFIKDAHTILWNGPFGQFEAGYREITETVAKLVAGSRAHSVVGGGDTIAAISDLDLFAQFGFCSIGGGAMLTYLERGTTPALEFLYATE